MAISVTDAQSLAVSSVPAFNLRTSKSQVLAFIQTSVTDITPYALMAHSLIDELLVPLNELDEQRLTQIETLLTCHFIFVYERTARLETAGPVTAQYDGATSMVFMASIQGQMALALDTTGTLAGLQAEVMDKDKKIGPAKVYWSGTDFCG